MGREEKEKKSAVTRTDSAHTADCFSLQHEQWDLPTGETSRRVGIRSTSKAAATAAGTGDELCLV